MTTAGTIDRPSARDPQQRPFLKRDLETTHVSDPNDRTDTDADTSRLNRNRLMQLMPESLARAHMYDRLHTADAERRALRLSSARRLQRRAERASLRARRALAMAIMQ